MQGRKKGELENIFAPFKSFVGSANSFWYNIILNIFKAKEAQGRLFKALLA